MQLLIVVLLPSAFLLPPGAQTGEIIRGWEARPHSRPYMAYVKIAMWRGVKTCGGFLIRDEMVLTAAHCNKEQGYNLHPITLSPVTSCHALAAFAFSLDWSIHDFDLPTDREPRVLSLHLGRRARLNEWVGLIPFPSAWQGVHPGAMCSVASWGQMNARRAKGLDVLREVDVVVLEDYVCLRNPDHIYRYYNTSTMLCAGDPKQGKDSFKGDSGGPLVCGKTAQGIVSWDSLNGPIPGCTPESPD